jgi:DNA topoisomerase-1
MWSRTGDPVDDADTLERIAALVIPPAWTDVWICPWSNGHIQAVGTDAAGRRQYMYHEVWRKRRDAEKFARALEFGTRLPAVREAVAADLAAEGLTERRVLAAAVRLLDIGCFRIGGEAYARDHETFGIATLRKDHVNFRDGRMIFCYPAKGSIPRTLAVSDPDVERVLRPLRRRRGGSPQLLAWKGAAGWTDVHSPDVNAYLKDVGGPQFSAKDFRTWSGTVFTAVQLALVEPPTRSPTARRRAIVAAVKEAAEHLGNTPAVCRSSYIDPRVLDRFEAGLTIADHGFTGPKDDYLTDEVRVAAEKALLAMMGSERGVASAA